MQPVRRDGVQPPSRVTANVTSSRVHPVEKALRTLLKILLFAGFSGLSIVVVGAAGIWYTVWPTLPDVESLRSVELQTPLRIYTRDRKLIREFGEKRRVPLTIAELPPAMKSAVIDTEDRNFYQHAGVDPLGIARAVIYLLREGRKGPGGSTITMQVARNFFLDRGKTYTRKLTEILLAFKIERELVKDEILELYLNKIFMGHRAYGVGAAAQVYYGKKVNELSLAQMAMIAGLPQRPSEFNPISNPRAAKRRRNHVLTRMYRVGSITTDEFERAKAEPLSAALHDPPVEVESPYLAEMVRLDIKRRYGETAFSSGYNIYTTIDARIQQAADKALRTALLAYDRRHGWRGPELKIDLSGSETLTPKDFEAYLADIPRLGGLPPALVTEVTDEGAQVFAKGRGPLYLPFETMTWARKHINHNRMGKKPKKPADVLAVGDVVRVLREEKTDKKTNEVTKQWTLSQLPEVEGALVALDPKDGRIVALSGGFDFNRSKFNRVVQAERQPGSSFKPFIYSAALEKGYTAATTVNDAPVVFDDPALESAWRPENYSGKSFGPTRLRWALTKSRNLVSIRLMKAIGINYALDHVRRFGIDVDKLPRDLSLSLGSGAVTPMQIATGYTVLANGGFQVDPYFVSTIESAAGEVIEAPQPLKVCRECENEESELATQIPIAERAPRVLTEENAWIMYSMLRDVITRGTARKAKALKRQDLAGKTGTTNDQRDAWFSGYNGGLVATAWVGFDQVRPLGRRETGGAAALPMWIDFMRVALDGVEEQPLPQPRTLVRVRIDPETGAVAEAGDPDAVYETFRPEFAPTRDISAGGVSTPSRARAVQKQAAKVAEKLF